MDVRVYFKREERDEESQGKMQGNGQFEMGGALGGVNIITSCYIIFCDNIMK